LIYNIVKEVEWKKVRQDVENFLENPRDLEILTQDNILRLLKPRD